MQFSKIRSSRWVTVTALVIVALFTPTLAACKGGVGISTDTGCTGSAGATISAENGTLWDLAKKVPHNTTVEAEIVSVIEEMNPGIKPAELQIGQPVKVPSACS